MPPTPYSGYQPTPASMMYQNGAPQYAAFDVSNTNRKINEDSLPAMPGWDTAPTRRIDEPSEKLANHNGLEMGYLGPNRLQTAASRGRGAYGQVPQHEQFGNSDLGAQRLDHNESYNDFRSGRLSPAPTYQTNLPEMTNDRFARSSYQYDYQPQQTPYAPTISTQYEPTSYPPSSMQRYESYGAPMPTSGPSPPYSMQNNGMPPNMLQPGRKPVNGSAREI